MIRSDPFTNRSRALLFASVLSTCLIACSRDHHEPHVEGEPHAEGETHAEGAPGAGVIELSPEILGRIQIRTATVSTRALPAELGTTGQVDFEQDRVAHVTTRVAGRVERVQADLGQQVKKGQVLAVVDSIELGQARAEYLQAKAQEELARQNFDRESGLFAERIASEKEMLAARAAHVEALAHLQTTEETLRLYGIDDERIRSLGPGEAGASLLPVRAPLSGRVVEKHVTVGELVTPERNLFTIADLAHVWIWIDVYERDLAHVHLEDDVEVEVDAFPGTIFRGKVTYLSDQVDADTRTVRARIDVDNTAMKLRPGMFARVRVSDPHQAPGALSPVVPEAAVQREGEKFIVFVARDATRFEVRQVTLGRKAAGLIEIRSGLAPGESVVVHGGFLLKSEASKTEMGGGHTH